MGALTHAEGFAQVTPSASHSEVAEPTTPASAAVSSGLQRQPRLGLGGRQFGYWGQKLRCGSKRLERQGSHDSDNGSGVSGGTPPRRAAAAAAAAAFGITAAAPHVTEPSPVPVRGSADAAPGSPSGCSVVECPVQGLVDRMSESGGEGATVAVEVAEASTPPSVRRRLAEPLLKAMVVENARDDEGDAAERSHAEQAEADEVAAHHDVVAVPASTSTAVSAPTVSEPEQTMPVMPVPVPHVMPPMPTPEPEPSEDPPPMGPMPSGNGNGSGSAVATASGVATSATDGVDTITLTSDQRARAAANRQAALKRRAQRDLCLTHQPPSGPSGL